MFSLDEVIEGLKLGHSYERMLEDDGGKEYVRPVGDDCFCHEVAGNAHGGWGGSNTMLIEELVMLKDRWAQNGWNLSK